MADVHSVVGLFQLLGALFGEAANPHSGQLCAACVRRHDHRYKQNTSGGHVAAAVCDFSSCVRLGSMRYNQGSLAIEFPPAVSAARSASRHTNTHTRCQQPHTQFERGGACDGPTSELSLTQQAAPSRLRLGPKRRADQKLRVHQASNVERVRQGYGA